MVPSSSLHNSPPRVKHFKSKVSQPTPIVTTLHGMNLFALKTFTKSLFNPSLGFGLREIYADLLRPLLPSGLSSYFPKDDT